VLVLARAALVALAQPTVTRPRLASTPPPRRHLQIWLAGFVAAFVVTLPPWPCYRRHPVAYRADVKPLPVELGGEGPTGPAAAVTAAKKRR
jgi:hypothetical protein